MHRQTQLTAKGSTKTEAVAKARSTPSPYLGSRSPRRRTTSSHLLRSSLARPSRPQPQQAAKVEEFHKACLCDALVWRDRSAAACSQDPNLGSIRGSRTFAKRACAHMRSLFTDRLTDRYTTRCKNCTDRTGRERSVLRLNPLSRGLYGLYNFYNGLCNGL